MRVEFILQNSFSEGGRKIPQRLKRLWVQSELELTPYAVFSCSWMRHVFGFDEGVELFTGKVAEFQGGSGG